MKATTEIKVLSVRQPFAHWLLHTHPEFGPKIFENRSWAGRSKFRGQLFIHVSRWDDPPPVNENGRDRLRCRTDMGHPQGERPAQFSTFSARWKSSRRGRTSMKWMKRMTTSQSRRNGR